MNEFERVERIKRRIEADLLELGGYVERRDYMRYLKGYVEMCAAAWLK